MRNDRIKEKQADGDYEKIVEIKREEYVRRREKGEQGQREWRGG